MELSKIFQSQRVFFSSHQTKDVAFSKEAENDFKGK